MAHGYAKLARGPKHFTAILHAIGVPFPEIMAWANIGLELFGDFAVLIGAFLTLASNGRCSPHCNLYGAAALWVQFRKAARNDFCGCTIWPGGIRSGLTAAALSTCGRAKTNFLSVTSQLRPNG